MDSGTRPTSRLFRKKKTHSTAIGVPPKSAAMQKSTMNEGILLNKMLASRQFEAVETHKQLTPLSK
jgi:hypothetical protein